MSSVAPAGFKASDGAVEPPVPGKTAGTATGTDGASLTGTTVTVTSAVSVTPPDVTV